MSIIEKFQRSVADHADRIALQTGDEEFSYRQLNDYSLSLSHQIKGERFLPNVAIPETVALLLGNGKDAIVVMLAVLQAGRAYVPLDNNYPSQRLAYMLADCGASLLLTNSENLELAYKVIHASGLNIQLMNIDNLLPISPDISASLPPLNKNAAVLYTSGSTGLPKKVTLTTDSIAAFCEYFSTRLNIGVSDKLMLTTSCSHAVSVLDILSCLFAGATIVPYDVRTNFRKEDFLTSMQLKGITILHTVPAFFRYITDASDSEAPFEGIRLLLLGGDVVKAKDMKIFKEHFSPKAYLVNLYGQTELLLATMHVLDQDSVEDGSDLSIGYPIELVEGSVLDEEGKELSVMSKGELVFSIKENGVVIKTGDIGRWLPDGTLEYIGRKDYQYKINGNRVHAAEIERAIDEIPGVGKCVVMMAEKRKEKLLTAYYTRDGTAQINPAIIKDAVRDSLPKHMIPQAVIELDAFPQLPNGKLDREALLSMEAAQDGEQGELVPPEMLSQLIAIWEKVLQTENIQADDNFFLLGGNSLHATEMISHIYLAFHIELEAGVIFDNQTITELARVVMKDVQEPNYLSTNN